MATRKYSVEIAIRALDLTKAAVVSVEKNFSSLNTKLKAFEKSTENIQAIGAKFQTAGIKMAVAGGAIVAPLALATNRAVEYQDAMAQIGTVTGQTADVVTKEVGEGFQRLSMQVGKNVGELQKSYYALVSAGVPASKAFDFLESSARSARAGFTEVQVAANAAAIIFNTYGEAAGSAANIQNILQVAQRKGRAEFVDIASNVGEAAALWSRAGVSVEQYIGAFAELTKMNSAPEAATQAKALLEALTSPAPAVNDMIKKFNKTKSAQDQIKLGFEEIKNTGVVAWLKNFNRVTGGSAEMVEMVTGGNIRAKQGIMNLISVIDSYKSTVDDMNKGVEKNNVLQENFSIASKTVKFQIDRMKVAIDNLMISIGSALLPALSAIAGVLTFAGNALFSFTKNHKTLTKVIVITAAAFGVILIVVGGLLAALGTLAGILPVIMTGFSIVAGFLSAPAVAAVLAFVGSLLTIPGAVMAIYAAIAAVIAVIASFVVAFVGGFVSGLLEGLAPVIANFKMFASIVIDNFKAIGGSIKDFLVNVWDKFIGALKWVAALGKRAGFAVGNWFSEITGNKAAQAKTPGQKLLADQKKALPAVVKANQDAAAKVKAAWTVAEGITAGMIFGFAASGSRDTSEASIGRQYKEGFASKKIASAVASGTASGGGKTNHFNIDRLELSNATDPDSMIFELEKRASMAGM